MKNVPPSQEIVLKKGAWAEGTSRSGIQHPLCLLHVLCNWQLEHSLALNNIILFLHVSTAQNLFAISIQEFTIPRKYFGETMKSLLRNMWSVSRSLQDH